MGRYQYELSHCCETSCCYTFSSGQPWCNTNWKSSICLCASSPLCGGWDKPTGFIRWNTEYSNGCNRVRSVAKLIACNDLFYSNDLCIYNDFPTDRIVIASMYGFMIEQQCDSSCICWSLMPVGQRQMFILPTECTVFYCMACNVKNLNRMPDGSYTYNGCFPNGTSNAQNATAPYFMSIESYPLPVLNSNGHMGNNGACQYSSPTAICSTGTANSNDLTIPVYTSGYVDCCPSCFIPLTYDGSGSHAGPALKGHLQRFNSLQGKLSADSNSSAKDAYILVSACGWWSGETSVPGNVAMTIMNWSFPMGGAIVTNCDVYYDQMARLVTKISCCHCYGIACGKTFLYPKYGPNSYESLSCDYIYTLPNECVCTTARFNVPPKSDKLVPHLTDNLCYYDEGNDYGCINAWIGICGNSNPPYFNNPLGYWTYKWSNGNSYYAVNTHC